MAESKKPEAGKSAGPSSVPMLVLVSTLATIEQRLAWAQAWLAHLSGVMAFLQTHHSLFLDQLPALPAELVLQKGHPLPYQLPLVGKKEAPGALLDMIRANNAALQWIIHRGRSPLGGVQTMTGSLITYRKMLLAPNAYRASELRQVMAGAIVLLFEQYVGHVLQPLLREANLRRQVQLTAETWRAANVSTDPVPYRFLTANDRAAVHDWLKRHDDATLAGFKRVRKCREERGLLIALCFQLKVPYFKTSAEGDAQEGIIVPPILDERVPLSEKKAADYLEGIVALKQAVQQFASEREQRIAKAKAQGAEEALKSLTLDRVLAIVRFLDAAKTVGAALEAGVITQEIWALAVREGSGTVLDLVDRVTRKAPLSHDLDRDLLRTLRREADQLRRAMVASAPSAEDDEDDLLGLLSGGDNNAPFQAPAEERATPAVSARSLGESAFRAIIKSLNAEYAGGYPKLPEGLGDSITVIAPSPEQRNAPWTLKVTRAFSLTGQMVPVGDYPFYLKAIQSKGKKSRPRNEGDKTDKKATNQGNSGKPLSKEDRAAAKRAARNGGTLAEQLKAKIDGAALPSGEAPAHQATTSGGTDTSAELPN